MHLWLALAGRVGSGGGVFILAGVCSDVLFVQYQTLPFGDLLP